MFDNWINSDLMYINDILNKNGEISQNLKIATLHYTTDWKLYQKCGQFSKR